MRRLPAVLLSLGLSLSLACAAHEKAGDRATATGDWKTAEREYARAVQDHPKDAELRAKHQDARAHALAAAQARARACAAGADWECALAEAQYALELDPGSAELSVLRRDAGREAGRLRLRAADEALDRGELPRAMDLVEAARAATEDAAVVAEARRLTPAVVRAAVREAERQAAALQYPAALDLLGRAARLDPGVGPRLDAVKADYERWKDAEAERLTREGDGLLQGRRFAEARARYEQAAALRPAGRAAALARYAGQLAEGEAALARRDFDAAERAFGEAARGGADDGRARDALERVRVRPWAVRLRSVRVARGGPGSGDFVLALTLPDGRAAQTAPRPGSYANLDASFVVAANAYDGRTVSIRALRGAGDRPQDLGAVRFALADLVERGHLDVGAGAGAGAILELRVECDPADLPEGAVTGLLPVPDRASRAPAFSPASGRSAGYRVAEVKAALGAADRDPAGRSEVRVELEQRGLVVVRTPREPGLALRPEALLLFAEEREPLVLRLVREDRRGEAVLLAQPLTGADLARGRLSFASPGGSTVELALERLRARRR